MGAGMDKFERVGDISQATLTTLRHGGHTGLADTLEARGTGYVDDGFVRVVAPGSISAHLGEMFENPRGAIPFATTALGGSGGS